MSNVIKQSRISFYDTIHTVVAANVTYNRRTSYINKTATRKHNDGSIATYGRMELDSHADTIVLGRNAIILQYTSRECDVAPYSDTYEPIRNIPIVTGATAITSATTGATFILVFNEAIWMGSHLEHSLLNPNQMRHHGITVQDNPYANEPLRIHASDDDFSIPLRTDGTIIFFNSRTPTAYELATCTHIVMSSAAPWNPREVQFPAHHDEEGDTSTHEIAHVSISDNTFDLSTLDFEHTSIREHSRTDLYLK